MSFNIDPNRSSKELLEDIRSSAFESFNAKSVAMVVGPFSALLVKISSDADKRADKLESLTKKLLWVTWGLLVLTLILLLKG